MSEHSMSEHTNAYETADLYSDSYEQPMVGPLDAPEKPSGLHPVNITQLVMGVAFAGLLLIWALVEGGVVDTSEYRWLLPIPWIAAGAAGLVATVLPSRKPSRQ